jgi:hypothetical protein
MQALSDANAAGLDLKVFPMNIVSYTLASSALAEGGTPKAHVESSLRADCRDWS